MRAVGVIPVRMGSTRFPGKPLADLAGKPMIQRVYECCLKAKRLDDVLIATDDERIFQVVEGFGGKVVMTAPVHPSGSDRIAEVARGLQAEVIVDIQGDEPFIEGELIDRLVGLFGEDSELQMATAATEFGEEDEVGDPNVVKVVCDLEGNALYFSRSAIPFRRNPTELKMRRHIGIYAYRRDFLLDYAEWGPSSLERTEGLEQLRALEHGAKIKVIYTHYTPVKIDTPEDLEKARARFSGSGEASG